MRVRFWGTRGSIPVAMSSAEIREKVVTAVTAAIGKNIQTPEQARLFVDRELDFSVASTFGGNSSCVEIDVGGDEYILCDAGSGLRVFGNHILTRQGPSRPRHYHLFMSHLHWDHIMGFPFFTPAYIPGNIVTIYGCHSQLEEAFRRQQAEPCFPVPFDQLGAIIEFVTLQPNQVHRVAGVAVTPQLQLHGGDSYGYRFESHGKSVVYSTDSEHKLEDPAETERFIEFFRNADLVIFDAMYSLAEAISVKEDWGHSSNVVGVELCQLAGARHLCLFHHEPIFSDARIADILSETQRLEEITRPPQGRPLHISAAYDGLEISI